MQEEFAKDMVSLPLFQRIKDSSIRLGLQGYALDPTDYDTSSAHAWSFPRVTTRPKSERRTRQPRHKRFYSARGRLEWLIFDKGYTHRGYDYQPALLTRTAHPGQRAGAEQHRSCAGWHHGHRRRRLASRAGARCEGEKRSGR